MAAVIARKRCEWVKFRDELVYGRRFLSKDEGVCL